MSKIIAIKKANYSLPELYDIVAREMGYADTSELHYDCRKINIAENIQDNLYEYYKAKAKETDPYLSDNDIKVGTTMLLAMSGPKVDDDLKANEVKIFDGFVC